MNRQRIKRLRDHLASLPDEKFGMEGILIRRVGGEYVDIYYDEPDGDRSIAEVAHTCGTAACIAGWAATLADPKQSVLDAVAYRTASDWLDLDPFEASALFMPEGYYSPGAYTRQDAIATLDRLLETGRVEWPR